MEGLLQRCTLDWGGEIPQRQGRTHRGVIRAQRSSACRRGHAQELWPSVEEHSYLQPQPKGMQWSKSPNLSLPYPLWTLALVRPTQKPEGKEPRDAVLSGVTPRLWIRAETWGVDLEGQNRTHPVLCPLLGNPYSASFFLKRMHHFLTIYCTVVESSCFIFASQPHYAYDVGPCHVLFSISISQVPRTMLACGRCFINTW